ncbi:MAG: C25 family cysteine peptidase [Caldilineales bacterium]
MLDDLGFKLNWIIRASAARVVWSWMLTLVLLGGTLAPVTAAPLGPWVEDLRVKTPRYILSGGGVAVEGYALNDVPGAPALPVWSSVVELPAGGDFEMTWESLGGGELIPQFAIPPVPAPVANWSVDTSTPGDLPSAVPLSERPDAAIYDTNAYYPAVPVATGQVQWQRGKRLLSLRVFPFQYNPVTRTLRYHPDIRIKLTVNSPSNQPASAFAPQPPAHAPAATSGALRIRTAARGMFRLTYNDLVTAGVPVDTVSPASFAMTYLGDPVAIEVTGEADGHFDPGDLVIFYAQPYAGRYQKDNVYWFTYGGTSGLRMAARAVTPTGSEPLVTTVTNTLHIELDKDYRTNFPRPKDADHWFDLPLSPDVATGVFTATRSYDLVLDDALTSGVVQIETAVHGGADRPLNPDKSVAVYLNSHLATTHRWEGMTYAVFTANAPAGALLASGNQIKLVAAVSQLPGVEFYSISPDWVTLWYPAQADAEGDSLYIAQVAAGANQVAVTGFTTPDVAVYDLRQPNAPVRLLSASAAAAGPGYTLSFWDEALPGPTYYLTSQAALTAPQSIEADNVSAWSTPQHTADYIAVVHPSLWTAIDPLLAYRAAEGLRVAKVDIQDVYDEWSYGRRDPEALRSFLSYAYHHWNAGEEPPQYVLLAGDGTYDFTGVSGTTLPNLIPPYLADSDPWRGENAIDNRFVSVDGPDDFLPDMALGRLPATSPADVAAVTAKIIAYETSAPAGDWQRRVVFVADNYADPAGNFHALSNDIRFNWLPAGYSDSTIYYNADYFSGSAMQTAIKNAYNNDAFLVQWFGHGSIIRWGSVAMFYVYHVPNLQANDVWPVTVNYTCINGYFVNVLSNYQSLAEGLVLTPQRGSVAALASSGFEIGPVLQIFNRGVTEAIFQQRIARAGEAVDAAKLFYFANSSTFMDVIDAMTYFGDPALKLRLPDSALATPVLAASRQWAPVGLPITVTAHLTNTVAITTGVDVALSLPAELLDPTALTASSSTPVYDNANRTVMWSGAVPGEGTAYATYTSAITAGTPGCTAITLTGSVTDDLMISSAMNTAIVHAVTPDVDCDGDVDVVDIQWVTARWGSAAGDTLYHQRYDLDGDDQIGLLDVVAAATAWQP